MGDNKANKILIIDDDEQDQKLIKRLLEREGFEDVNTAGSGVDGIFFAEEQKPNIILVDTRLPGIDGFETAKRILAIEDIETKIIIMTGAIEAVDATKARESGASQYCAKTKDCAKLILAVKQFVD